MRVLGLKKLLILVKNSLIQVIGLNAGYNPSTGINNGQ